MSDIIAAVGWARDACTLPTTDRPLRLAEFDDLFATTLRTIDRTGPVQLRLILSGAADLEATVRDLAAREAECCAFFTFTVTLASGQVVLDIEVPPAHREVLDALADRATRVRGAR